jgi:LysM repeat protein
MSVDQLKSLNGLNSNLIHPGEKLRVSGSASTRTAGASRGSSSGGSYTVRGGDTLWGISRKHGVSVTRLKNANGLSGNTIQPGQRLTIP